MAIKPVTGKIEARIINENISYLDSKTTKMEDLDQEVKEAMTGGSVPIVGDKSVYTGAIQEGAVTLDKTTVDIFPHNIVDWGTKRYTFEIGKPPVYVVEDYDETTKMYRHDTSILIKVVPGTKFKIVNDGVATNTKVSVWEYDSQGRALKDSDYQDVEIQTTWSTNWVRVIAASIDNSYRTLEDMLKFTEKLRIEGPRSGVLTLPTPIKQGTLTSAPLNLANNLAENWRNGEYTIVDNRLGNFVSNDKTIMYQSSQYIFNMTGKKKVYLSFNDAIYDISFYYIDVSWNVVKPLKYYTKSGVYFIPDPTNRMLPIVKRKDGGPISPIEIKNIKLVVADDVMADAQFNYSNQDVVKVVEAMSQSGITNDAFLNLMAGGTKWIGHSGTGKYAPENTLEAMRMAKEMRMWGAECDIKLTQDKKLVLMHDASVDRTTNGTGDVNDLTLAEILALEIDTELKGFENVKVPTFESYLIECKKLDMYPVIELTLRSQDDYLEAVNELVDVLSKFNMLQSVIVISFNLKVLKAIRDKNKVVMLALITNVGEQITSSVINEVKALGNCGLDIYCDTYLTSNDILAIKKEGLPVLSWTSDSLESVDHMMSIGVDAITTNAVINKVVSGNSYYGFVETNDGGVTWISESGDYLPNLKLDVARKTSTILTVQFPGHLAQVVSNMPIKVTAEEVAHFDKIVTSKIQLDEKKIEISLYTDNHVIDFDNNSLSNLKLKVTVQVM